jgi:iron complex outermembrane receptor protein/vitamin B12 transporter
MSLSLRRSAAAVSMGFGVFRSVAFTVLVLLLATSARAVVVRGRLTDALGKPIANGQVKLMQDGAMAGLAFADANGFYEVRSSQSGRFILIGIGRGYLPSLGEEFYGGVTDVLQQDVVLSTDTVRQQVSVAATGIPTPLPQLTAPVSVIQEQAFALDLGVNDELRQTPGAFVVQSGQIGGVTSLFMRGGQSTDNLVLVDGIPAEDVGGIFDYGTVSSTGIGSMEVYRGPNSAMYGTDAGAAVVAITTPRGTSSEPLLTYSGDAGNLHTWRNEVTGSGVYSRLDYLVGFSRFDTSNAVQLDRYHSGTSVANLGYNVNGNTQIRFTIRNADSVEGVPGPFDFQGVSQDNRQGDQDIYSGVTLENRTKDNWHNLVRFGIARKREQEQEVSSPSLGNTVTIRGANGYSATGQVQLYTGNSYDQDSNRNQLYYQTDYSFNPHFIALFGFRYDDEHGSYNDYDPSYSYVEHQRIQRTNFEYNLQFQGQFWGRLFYSVGGAVEKNHLYGIAGTPKLGLSYVPVRPSAKAFHGTRLRANAATGVQEPSLSLQYNSLYAQLTPAQIAQFHVTPPNAERSRTYDLGIDQNILSSKLVLKAGYFHNVFDRQLEGVDSETLFQDFNISVPEIPNPKPGPPYVCASGATPVNGLCPLPNVYTAYINSFAFRADGAELELQWKIKPRIMFRGGYTYLDTKVVQSFASDAVAANQGAPNENPNIPGVPIGFEGPLVGARPFRRAPHTGYFDVQYTRTKFAMVIKGAMAGRSDDSTFLQYADANYGNSLLLPNRDLDFGYVKLDLGGTYSGKHGLTYFAQIENLLNDQHIGPIGYPGLPLTFRAGVKLQLGGN